MASVRILPCTLKHLRELAANLRPGDCAELMAPGQKVRHILHDIWVQSDEPRCALVDGKVAACWGVTTSLLATEGEPWLFTTAAVEKVPIRFLKQAQHEIKLMLKTHHSLVSAVASDYTRAIRFFQLLGFSVSDFEHKVGPEQKAFREIRLGR